MDLKGQFLWLALKGISTVQIHRRFVPYLTQYSVRKGALEKERVFLGYAIAKKDGKELIVQRELR